ncbi:MAG: NifU family protein [Bacteroidia bacterium]|nr:NifU family protein [Bacteroidia bacterium]
MELLNRIEEALAQIRPYLLADNGDIKLVEVVDDKAYVALLGACSNCNMSMMTMKAGVEQAILKSVPEIKSVLVVATETTQ